MTPLFRSGMMPNVLVQTAVRHLGEAGVPDAPRDARLLLAHAMGLGSYVGLTRHMHDPVSDAVIAAYERVIAARISRQPVSQIIGRRQFCTRFFHVTPDVLDPRPETETLIELAKAEPYTRVLDLGTGSGAILLTLLADRRGESTGVGVDLTEAACQVAFANAQSCGVIEATDIFISDWYEHVTGQFDLVVSNPPYIAAHEMDGLAPEVRDWEPHTALTDGADGLRAYHAIAAGLRRHLAPRGRVLLEIGPTQGAAVRQILEQAGVSDISVHPDLDGRDRVVSGRNREGF